jgi:hypothetical protein
MKKIITGFCLGLFVLPGIAQNIIGIEYFWDEDPGIGQASFVNIVNVSEDVTATVDFSTVGLTAGLHVLGIRTTNGTSWSPVESRSVMVHRFSGLEYYWDQDPGVGNGEVLPMVSTQTELNSNFDISTIGLNEGNHTLFVRSLLMDNRAGITEQKAVWVTNPVVAAEYYWDHDPGVGIGVPIPVNNSGTTIDIEANISTAGLDTTVDIHYLVVRTLAASEAWSVALDTALFLGPVSVEKWPDGQTMTAVYPNPTSGQTSISAFSPQTTELKIELLNASGQVLDMIYQGQFSGRNDLYLDLTKFSAGAYLLRFTSKQDVWLKTIVIE